MLSNISSITKQSIDLIKFLTPYMASAYAHTKIFHGLELLIKSPALLLISTSNSVLSAIIIILSVLLLIMLGLNKH